MTVEKTMLRLPKPEHLEKVFGLSTSMSAQYFFDLIDRYGVTAVADTRLSRNYLGAAFSTGRDLPFFCDEFYLEYMHLTELSPTREMRETLYRQTMPPRAKAPDIYAWTNFLEAYARTLATRDVFGSSTKFSQLLYGKHKAVALICACQSVHDCHLQVVLGAIKRLFPELQVGVLTPDLIGGDKPERKKPARVLRKAIPFANLQPQVLL